jgi:hypothetical protein
MSSTAAKITIVCPKCGNEFHMPAHFAGRAHNCHRCGAALPVPPIPLTPAAPRAAPRSFGARESSPTLGYGVKTPTPTGRVDPFDPFVGNRFKNLYVPLLIIAGSLVFDLLGEIFGQSDHNLTTYTGAGPAAAVADALVKVATDVAAQVPVMLLACFLAARFLGFAFGSLWLAILKLISIAMTPSGAIGLVFSIGWSIKFITGVGERGGWMIGLSVVIGILLGLLFYFQLFMYFFDMDPADVGLMIFTTWITQTYLNWLAQGAVHKHFFYTRFL